jgi:hypothetical protein
MLFLKKRSLSSFHPRKLSSLILTILVFFAGIVTMSLEFSVSRLLIPVFGSSIYTWGSLIGVILAGLSLGYHIGGRLADKRDPRIAISVVEQYNPYNMVSIKGRVIEQTFDGADEHLHKLAKKYLGIGRYYYRRPKHRRIVLKVKPEKIMGLSLHSAFYFLAYSPYRLEIKDI